MEHGVFREAHQSCFRGPRRAYIRHVTSDEVIDTVLWRRLGECACGQQCQKRGNQILQHAFAPT